MNCKGEIVKFFERLAANYSPNEKDQRQLLDFVDREKFFINLQDDDSPDWKTSIICQLLENGFRSDGIAYLLTCIAEGLLQGVCKFQSSSNITQETLNNNKALEIYSAINRQGHVEEC